MRIPLLGKGKAETAIDPVCHMDVDVKNPSGGTHEHEGQTYYFCGPGCRVAFSKEPTAYLSGEKSMEM
ncbi:MAG: YHS domain-containing protein [Dehalococcoidia bacterium]|jgi:Cu+-exporting ATPase|nr:YHS domain-containing protein [Dehalococcoidia bacterium]